MNNQKLFHFFLLTCLFSFYDLKSQIVASPTSACAPASIVFSGPSGASNEYWSFGSGMGTSTLPNPNVLYTNAGTYNVTYTAIVGGNPVAYSTQVIVKPVPTANFSYVLPPTHCAPMTVNFTASGNASNPQYSWSFGDLSSLATGASLTHIYTYANNFIPVVTVTDLATGCSAIATPVSGGTIHVSSTPTISFSSSNGYAGCAPPFVTTFNGSGSTSGSPSGGGLTFNWSFSGGTPSSAAGANSGAISFSGVSNTVNVTVTDNNFCSSSASSVITVVNPALSATVTPTVCINSPVSATIQTTSTSIYIYMNGSSAPIVKTTTANGTTLIDTLCILTLPGINTITITIPTANGCPAVLVQKQVFVEEVIANFVPSPSVTTCQSLSTITYVNLSSVNNSSSLTYNWSSFWVSNASHHGAPTATSLSTPANVTFTFWQGSLNPYTNYMYFTPTIDLAIISSPTGCKTHTNIGGTFVMARTSARFTSNKKQGCAPLVVNYSTASSWIPATSIASYTWCNGESPPTYSIGTVPAPPNPGANMIPPNSFTYNTPGTYYPYLALTTINGCDDKSYVDTVTVVNPPTNLSATYPSNVCAGVPITINMSGTGMNVPSSSGINHWHVDTDNHFFSGCYTNPSPTYSFTHVGTHNVSVSASQAGCESTTTMGQTILVKGPIGKFQHETNCNVNRKSVNFYVHLQETSSAVLNYGDGNQITISGNLTGSSGGMFTHVYANNTDYIVTLTSTHGFNGCAPHVYTKTIKIRDAKARITYNNQPLPVFPAPLACTKTPIKFSSATSSDYAGCLAPFTWFFQSPPTISPAAPGITMTPLSIGVTAYKTYSTVVLGPPTDTIWKYVVPQLLDTFRTAGNYTIGLRVKDENGCVDIQSTVFRIGSAEPIFTITPNPQCLSNGTVVLTNSTDAAQIYGDVIKKYIWIFGDGSPKDSSTTGLSTLLHTIPFATPPFTIFSASLIAKNQIGCIDTAAVSWQVNRPFANFGQSTQYPCVKMPPGSGGPVTFFANSGYATYSVSYGDSPQWTTYTNYSNVVYTYTTPGTYTPTIKIYDAIGCTATETLVVNAIGQPTASFYFPDSTSIFCKGIGDPYLKSNSMNYVSPITGYAWSLASKTNTVSSPSGTLDFFHENITGAGVYTISMTVDVNGHCPHTTSVTVTIINLSSAAALSQTMFCLGQTITASITPGESTHHWQWHFGDFVQQPWRYLNVPNPKLTENYPYTIYPTTSTTGSAVVVLQYYSETVGCEDQILIPIQVIKLESDFKHALDDYTHCLGIEDAFISTTPNPLNLNLSYFWNYGDLNTGTGHDASHTYSTSGTFTVRMTAFDTQYNCENTSIKTITVFPLPKAQLVITPTLSCPNATYEVQGGGTPGVSGFLTATLSPVPGNPTLNLAPTNNTFITTSSASVETVYSLIVQDDNTCISKPVFDTMFIQPPTRRVDWDTSIIIGQTLTLNAFLGDGFTYTWSPVVTNLNCQTCLLPDPVSNTMVDITYTVLVEDDLKCSIVKNRYSIHVIPVVSLDVPTAFTPNGDGTNDYIYPGGWGLKKLNYFKVFNRWGQLVFESNDLAVGWDGNYGGVPQNMETYVYQVSAETYLETEPTLTKTGTFKLIR